MNPKIKVKNSSWIKFRKFSEKKGDLFVGELNRDLPFQIKRVFFIENFNNLKRGQHVHKKNEEIIFAARGSFVLTLDDGQIRQKIKINNPRFGVYLGKNLWREMSGFSKDCLIVSIASRKYEAGDYVHSYEDFIRAIKKK